MNVGTSRGSCASPADAFPRREGRWHCATLLAMEAPRTSSDELRELYRADYVDSYHQEAGRRLKRLVDLADLSREMTVADLACGNGLLLDLVAGRVGHYYGVDFSEEFITEARRRHDDQRACGVEFVCQSIEEFCDSRSGSIDRAFSLDFVEHVYDAELLPILRSIRSCLQSDGRLYVHTPNAEFFLEILKERGILPQFPEHIAVRDARDNQRLLQEAGFSRVEVTHLPHYLPVMSWLHHLSGIPALGRFLNARLFLECWP